MTSEPAHKYGENGDTKASVSQGPTSSDATETGLRSASVLNSAKNTRIKRACFNITNNTTNVGTVSERILDVLHKRVAPYAILNAGGRADQVRCHPGTRKEVIGRIDTWRREALHGRAPPIFWLSGPAGAGKSAIVQTVAEGWRKEAIPQANFFFFRTDPSRSSLSPLVATLVHQLILLYPLMRDSIETLLSTNPLILDSSTKEQVVELIINPLNMIRESSSSYRPPVLLIDGLDECDSERKDSQRRILHALDNVLEEYPGCFYLLVASRDESQIRATFNQISTLFLPLYLDNKYSPEDDIRVFVNDEFKKIKKSHPLAHTLDESWPSRRSVDNIVTKSSGQFIYAATVMRFIADASDSPMISLERVQRAEARTTTRSPFPQLDAIYDYVLSQVNDHETLRDILHAHLLLQNMETPQSIHLIEVQRTFVPLLRAYNPKYTEAIIQSCLAEMTPFTRYTDDQTLLFYHASFPDYLMDWSRSGDNCVDLDAFSLKVFAAVWGCTETTQNLYFVAVSGLFRLTELPSKFFETVVELKPLVLKRHSTVKLEAAVIWELDAFEHIHNLCVKDHDFISFARIIRAWKDCSYKRYHVPRKLPPRLRSITRHFLMMSVESDITNSRLAADTMTKLDPATDLDTREIGIWLDDLLHRIRSETYGNPDKKPNYRPLLKQWLTYALVTNIPMDDFKLDDLPGVWWYLWECKMERGIEAIWTGRWEITNYEHLHVLQLALLGAQIL